MNEFEINFIFIFFNILLLAHQIYIDRIYPNKNNYIIQILLGILLNTYALKSLEILYYPIPQIFLLSLYISYNYQKILYLKNHGGKR